MSPGLVVSKIASFNRTTLELKYSVDFFVFVFCCLLIAPHWNWNNIRTVWFSFALALLIAPHWNWNKMMVIGLKKPTMTFNRTTLELKFFEMFLRLMFKTTFNRTTLELKFFKYYFCITNLYSFNRTTLELKFSVLLYVFRVKSLLICLLYTSDAADE